MTVKKLSKADLTTVGKVSTARKRTDKKIEEPTWVKMATGKLADAFPVKTKTKIAREALKSGHVAKDHLVFILASSEKYQRQIPILWERFGLRGEPCIETPEARVDSWYKLLTVWTVSLQIFHQDSRSERIEMLETFKWDSAARAFVKRGDESLPDYVRLDALRVYFKDRDVPLPNLLFPLPQAKPRLLKEKEKVRKAAVLFWRNNPSKQTIRAAIESAEVKTACSKPRTDKTIRNWIKDLAPSNAPGRPKGE